MACCQTSAHESLTVPQFRDNCISQDMGTNVQIQLMVRGLEDLIKAELESVRNSQEFIEKRQIKLEQVLVDWMAKASYEPPNRASRVHPQVRMSVKINDEFQSSNALLSPVPVQPSRVPELDMAIHGHQASVEASRPETPQSQASRNFGKARRDEPIVKQIVFHNGFDLLFSALILLNAVAIGAEVEYKTMHEKPSTFFKATSFSFAFLFTVELCMRLAAHGAGQFFDRRSPAFAWNFFDCVMVFLSLIEVIDNITTGGESGSGTAKSLLRLVRMARLMRIIRVLRFSPQLRMMLFMILESTKSLSYVMFLIVSILCVFSIIFTMAGTEYLGVPGDTTFDTQLHSEEVQKYYGTIPRSLYTCFRAMTGGQSWGEVMDPLVDISAIYASIFLFFIAFSIFTLLNIVTGVFVEAVSTKAFNDRELVVEKEVARKKACIQNLQLLFEESDIDRSGAINLNEFVRLMKDEKVLAYLAHLSIDTSNVKELFHTLDKDNSGSIEIDEFVDNLMHLMRGQTVEQYVQKLMNENRRVQHNLFRFMAFVEVEFKHIKSWVERREKLLRNSVENVASSDILAEARGIV